MSARFSILAVASVLLFAACHDDDGELRRSVEARLATEPGASGVSVSVDNRVVQLSGVVDTPAERTRIEEAVEHVDRVLAVRDELVVGQPTRTTSAEVDARRALQASIEAQLHAAGLDAVRVRVEGDTVHVVGSLPREQHDDALAIVRKTAPELRVDDTTVAR